ncbi:MAG: queuosine precursor transporter [Deltaproteobacteria bacterium]|nr:queuosine precursor transporter [Deltaproteobacteria bacterium]
MSATARRDRVFLLLAGIFIATALLGELTGGKLIQVGPFLMSVGIIPWPVVLLTTDIMNEFYGRHGVRRITLMTVGLIVFTFLVLFLESRIAAAPQSAVSDAQFIAVFGQSMWIIVGSVIAFLTSQFIDVIIFWAVRRRTGGKWLWLRTSGSTAVSQLVDSFVITAIAFWLPGKLSVADFVRLASANYSYKLIIAVAMTPFIYAAHTAVARYLGSDEASALTTTAAQESIMG